MGTATPPSRERPRLSARYAIGAVLLVAFGLQFALDAVLYPWSISWPGRPALVGEWYGEVLTPTGKKQHLALTLEAETQRCAQGCSRLKVSAQLCEARAAREYDGLGTVENWTGTYFNIALTPSDGAVNARALRLRGAWHRQMIRGTLHFGPKMNQGPVVVTENASDAMSTGDADRLFAVPLTLRRGSERDFRIACRRMQ